MNLGSLQYAPGSRKNKKRLGRGRASGTGKTSGRGHKGYGSRSGSKSRPWMEGGTMPIYRRLPKRGFKNIFKEYNQVVNLAMIDRLQMAEVTPEMLYEHGMIESLTQPTKILGNGEITQAVTVKAHAFSKTAKEKIEAAGGKAEVL